jgi:O-antigen/teichoic acid export membrane protein
MFLTILVFPTAVLQANVLVAMKYEKLDMWFNVISLITFLTFCSIGIYFFKSLTVINISIFLGFLFFHILQDIVLVKKKVSSSRNVFEFYILSILSVASYILLQKLLNPVVLFLGYWTIIVSIYFLVKKLRVICEIKISPKASI